MPLPVIPQTFRVTLNLSPFAGISPVNVFHVLAATGDVVDVGNALEACVQDNMLAMVSAVWEPTSWTILPLDGTSASFTKPRSNPATMCGIGAADNILEGACILKEITPRRGPSGRGRLFIGPIAESAQDDGVVDASLRADLVGAWTDFQTAMAAEGDGFPMVVASYVNELQSTVIAFDSPAYLATQRRRLVASR